MACCEVARATTNLYDYMIVLIVIEGGNKECKHSNNEPGSDPREVGTVRCLNDDVYHKILLSIIRVCIADIACRVWNNPKGL